MNWKKVLRHACALAIIIAVAVFFYLEFQKNADVIRAFHFHIHISYCIAAAALGSVALMIGPLIWRSFVNDYLHKKLNFCEAVSFYNTSALFKYIPGKIWNYAAQIALMSSKGIPNTALIYINLACFVCFAFVSFVYASGYFLFYTRTVTGGIYVLCFVLLLVLDFIFIVRNASIMNYLIIPLNRFFRMDIHPVKIKKMIFVYTQLLQFIGYLLIGMAVYLLARGMGLEVPFNRIIDILATITLAGILGSLAFFTPGGLGVREGVMFMMLKQFTGIETALILPVMARLLYVIVELILGIAGIMIGLKYGYFPDLLQNRQDVTLPNNTQPDTN
ncbi:MAG: flippase-like domain-containing protein [Smithella sp.]|nr:flippase-like domain-containing protein [Smithella sp.]MDM7987889.1 lysylphosphatidylglycerol synthase domain-containing protein [Smithella sp.]HOU50266.1 lysylphosphatidylglycerol synthase domain-containing protein [Smithella sp.]HQG65225.1 lysylphosphatidylglycerol synthase domain-containing protein [Smithella sp.]HQH16506.1 lysylphosphatidylglycerol synthase domain-containing protein [Smithella sp.]